VSVVDLENMKVIDEISLLPYKRPHGISLDPITGVLAVSVENPDKVLLIDPAEKRIINEFDSHRDTPHMVLLAPGGKQLFIANTLSDDLVITDIGSGEYTEIAVGHTPQGMVLDPTREILFVSCVDYTAVIDLIKKEEIHQIPLGANRLELTQNDSLLLMSSSKKGIGFVDAHTCDILYHLDLGYRPFSLNVSSDGLYAYVAAEEQNLIFIVAINERKIIRKFRMPEGNRPDPVIDIGLYSENAANRTKELVTPVPRFERIVIDSTFAGGYQIKSADMNGDGLDDLIAVSGRMAEIFWYENPYWQKHLVSDQTERNIDVAPKDIDGDGRIDLALASQFNLNNSTRGGGICVLASKSRFR
jgi:hypothetical protein